jgi:hypothetical protein
LTTASPPAEKNKDLVGRGQSEIAGLRPDSIKFHNICNGLLARKSVSGVVPHLRTISRIGLGDRRPFVYGVVVLSPIGGSPAAKDMALEWQAETIRVSLFSNEAVKVTDVDWHAITGQDEAPIRQTLSHSRTLAGPFLGGDFAVSALLDRTVCFLTPAAPGKSTPEEGFPTVGEWRSTFNEFLKATRGWVEKYPVSVTRLGVAATLLARYADKDSANTVKGIEPSSSHSF